MLDQLPFAKMSGAGNDFIVVAAEDCRGVDPGWLAGRVCTRALSLGGDGLIVVGPGADNAVEIAFYNPDGSRAEMCGNGSRCAARFAVEHGLVAGDSFRLATDSGELPVRVLGDGRYEVVMPEPARVQLELTEIDVAGCRVAVHGLWVGVPHAVLFVPEVERLTDERLIDLGRGLRYDAEHFPAGTNVNFTELPAEPGEPIRLRTYERGVENLTKACGTGSTAAAVVVHQLGGLPWPIELQVDGGRLMIDRRDERLWLSGDARLVARGTLGAEALSW